MKKFEVQGHEPSYLPAGEWRLIWSDEFDGTELDRTKWDFRLNFWGEPFDAYTDQGDRKSTRLNSSHNRESRMPSSA